MATVDLGKISYTQKGTYAGGTTYAPKDVVQYTDQNETSSFVKINSSAAGQAPQTNGTINSSHWAIFAKGTSLATPNQGAYAGGTTYKKGDIVQQTDSGVVSTFLFINNTPTAGQTPSTSGTVNTTYWQLVAKGTSSVGLALQSVHTAATLTAVAGNIYPIDTSSNAVTVTLPASPSVGDEIVFFDYASNFDTNSLTVTPGGSTKLEGQTVEDGVCNLAKQVVHLIYVDATKGWLPIQSQAERNITLPPRGQTAYTTAGSYTFTVPAGVTSVAVVCVGAGGGNSNGNSGGAGGGGALSYRNAISVTAGQTAAVVVGAGKAQGAGAGGSSSFTYGGTATTAGGGGAGTTSAPSASGGAGGTGSGTSTANYAGGSGGGDGCN